jgi:hypothetical protein
MLQPSVYNTTRVVSSARPNDSYSYIYATTDEHAQITSLQQLRRVGTWQVYMGFFLNGVAIGHSRLEKVNWRKKHLHTTNMELGIKWRNKGHGIALYTAIIQLAKSLGVKRLYSDRRLNKFSSRMWKEKLKRYGYDVKISGGECSRPCAHCRKHARYYIDL